MTTANGYHAITRLEFTVLADTDSITDETPPELEETSAGDDLAVDGDEHTDESDEAAAEEAATESAATPDNPIRRRSWTRILAYAVLPALALVLALGAGYLKWQDGSARLAQEAGVKTVKVATESTIAMLSYRPATAEKDLTAATDRLTGSFRDAYTKLIKEVVIPGAKQKQVSAVATVPAAALVSATENHAVVLVFIDQTTMIGTDPPISLASSVRVTLDKVHDRWLVSQFDPV